MKKLFLFLLIGFTVKDNRILSAARSTNETVNVGQHFLIAKYIHNLNTLLNSSEGSKKLPKIPKLGSFLYDPNLRNSSEIRNFFFDNKSALLKFVDAQFLVDLIICDEYDLLRDFLNKYNVNSIVYGRTLLMHAIKSQKHLNSRIVRLILAHRANVNQIIPSQLCGQTALGNLIFMEGEIRHKYANQPKVLTEKLWKIGQLARLLFDEGADITIGKIRKSSLSSKLFGIKEDVNLIDLINNPQCETVFARYAERKKWEEDRKISIAEDLKNLDELLASSEIQEICQEFNEKLSLIFSNLYYETDETIQYFKNNRKRILKFISDKTLRLLLLPTLLYNNLKYFEVFFNSDNINNLIDTIGTFQTVLIGAIDMLSPKRIKFALKKGADVNQIVLDRFFGETALGALIFKEAQTRNRYAHSVIRLEKKLKKVREIARMLFEANAHIAFGGKMITTLYGLEPVRNLIDLIDNPQCKVVFEEYENYKKNIAEKMMSVSQIAKFPPGLVPICLAYLFNR